MDPVENSIKQQRDAKRYTEFGMFSGGIGATVSLTGAIDALTSESPTRGIVTCIAGAAFSLIGLGIRNVGENKFSDQHVFMRRNLSPKSE